MTGTAPPSSVERQSGVALSRCVSAASAAFPLAMRQAVDWALALDSRQRPQTIEDWQAAWQGAAPVPDFELQPEAASAPQVLSPALPDEVGIPAVADIAQAAVAVPARPRRSWRVPAAALLLVAALVLACTLRPAGPETAAPRGSASALVPVAKPEVVAPLDKPATTDPALAAPGKLVVPSTTLVLSLIHI